MSKFVKIGALGGIIMEFIKKFAREISVFGIVLVIFLALFTYRQITFKDFKTIKESELTEMVKDKESFVVVLGNSADATVLGYQEIMTKYTTQNRDIPLSPESFSNSESNEPSFGIKLKMAPLFHFTSKQSLLQFAALLPSPCVRTVICGSEELTTTSVIGFCIS